ncbi:GNAT family N-acetyltransferase [Actinotalea sp.]|uniref:GNAT family N-acetyltransferase n=1 Tax=Actinotalea sp. TaxID=1872145 RepID=UPI003569BDB8
MRPEQLLTEFHEQVRLQDRDSPPGRVVDRDGPVHRSYEADPAVRGAMIESPSGLGPDPDLWIARQVAFFGERRQDVEWKAYSTDEPADLGQRLVAAGFVAEEVESLVLGSAADLVHEVHLPSGVRIREISSDEDWDRTLAMMGAVWGEGAEWVSHRLRAEQREAPELLRAVVVEQGDPGDPTAPPTGPVLSFSMLRPTPGTRFCGLWGGTTDAAWRGRGLYRASVAWRARLALDLGYPSVRVDCSADSLPILVRLGLHAVATTTPYVLRF